MYIPFKFSIPFPIKWFKVFFPKIINLLRRPKLFVDLSSKRIIFVTKNNQDRHLPYFCLTIKNISNQCLNIDAAKISINESFYKSLIREEIIDEKWWSIWKSCKNNTLLLYRNNWEAISQDQHIFELNSGEEKTFPMRLPNTSCRVITNSKHSSLLFFNKNKVSIAIEINGKIYEYGLNRKIIYEKYMYYTAFECETDKSKKNEDKKINP